MRTILKFFSLCCASALFTQPLQAEKLNPVTTAAISSSLRQFTQGIRTGKIVVDSSAVSTDSVKIFLNTALQDVPMRSDNVSEILKTVSAVARLASQTAASADSMRRIKRQEDQEKKEHD